METYMNGKEGAVSLLPLFKRTWHGSRAVL